MKQITIEEKKDKEFIQDLINEMKSEHDIYSVYWEYAVLEDVSERCSCETNLVENKVYYVSKLIVLNWIYNVKFTKTFISEDRLEMIDFIKYVEKELVEECWNERVYLQPLKGMKNK